jgi:hypothetical protein
MKRTQEITQEQYKQVLAGVKIDAQTHSRSHEHRSVYPVKPDLTVAGLAPFPQDSSQITIHCLEMLSVDQLQTCDFKMMKNVDFAGNSI